MNSNTRWPADDHAACITLSWAGVHSARRRSEEPTG